MTILKYRLGGKDTTVLDTEVLETRLHNLEVGLNGLNPIYAVGTAKSDGWTIGAFNLTKIGKVVTCDLNIAYHVLSTLGAAYFTIPSGFRPKSKVEGISCGLADGVKIFGGVATININGDVVISSAEIPVKQVFFNASWTIA